MNTVMFSEKLQVKDKQENIRIQENKEPYIKHDLLFKQLIQIFFKEFLEAFFPEVYSKINFSTIKFLPEEIFTDIVDGETRRLDIVVQAKLSGTNTLIIIHIEPQSYEQKNFNERMFQYYSFLYNEYRLPIIPIAIFSYDEGWIEDEFSLEILSVGLLKFRYLTLHLKSMNWKEFIKQDNPVAAALLSKMGYSREERVQIKIEFLRMIVRLQVNPAEQRLLYGFFESYLILTEEEEEKFMSEARELDGAEEILEIPISYEERGKEIGREEGREKGRVEGREEGREEGRIEIALGLLREGVSKEIIMKTTNLSLEKLEELEQRL